MARTALTYTTLTADAVTADPSDVALDATYSHTIASAVPERTILRITNTTSSQKTVTIKAGHYPPAWGAGLGDLVVTLAAGNVTPVVKWVGPLESGRFIQSDGSLSIDVASGMTGTIGAFKLPKSA